MRVSHMYRLLILLSVTAGLLFPHFAGGAADDPDTLVIVLTSYDDEDERQAAYMAGATRYLLKDIDSTQLVYEILNSEPSPSGRSA